MDEYLRIVYHDGDVMSPLICPKCGNHCGVVYPAGPGTVQYTCPYCGQVFMNLYVPEVTIEWHERPQFTIIDRNAKGYGDRKDQYEWDCPDSCAMCEHPCQDTDELED